MVNREAPEQPSSRAAFPRRPRIYKDPTVQMQTITQRLAAGLLAAAGNLFVNRFTGPGRVALQSMSLLVPTGSGSQ